MSNKKVYVTEGMAEDALIEAHVQFYYKPNTGPIAVYKCEDCGYFHLTSQGPINPKLLKLMNEGKIKLQREANQWSQKIKKK